MDIHTNIPLKNYTTMKLGGNARFMADAHTPEDVARLHANASSQQLPLFVLGGGSNTIVHDEGFSGLVLRNRIRGFDILADDATGTTFRIGAGELWDDIVRRTVEMNLTGIEAMSAIPGTIGAAPVQNIGAYGQEVADTLVSIEAYDTREQTFVTVSNEACNFSYRSSIFREEQTGRFIITYITLRLYKAAPAPPFYAALETYLSEHGITLFTAQVIRDAVIAIRKEKLPDPAVTPNAGSFFKNAIIERWQLDDLKRQHPDIPIYDMPDGRYKVPTGWLIEALGFKGKVIDGIRVHDKNALVLINESATSYQALARAKDEIIGAIRDTYRIQVSQEPLELGA